MRPETHKRLGRVLQLARPLTPAELKAAQRWFPGATVHHIVEMRMRAGGGRFCVVQGGRQQ